MFEYAIEVLEYTLQCAEENLVSGLWKLEKIPLKLHKLHIKELSVAIKLLQKESDDTEDKILKILDGEGEK